MGMSPHVRRLREAVGRELLVLPSVCGVVYDERGRILLVEHANRGVWSVPGGAVDPEEEPADAVVRELWEETGLWTRPLRLLGVFGGKKSTLEYENGDRTNYVITAFECEVLGGTLRPDHEETVACAFVARADLASLPLSPWVLEALLPLYDRPREAQFAAPAWRPPGYPPAS